MVWRGVAPLQTMLDTGMVEKGGRPNLYHRWLARRSSSPDHADTGMVEKGGRLNLYYIWLGKAPLQTMQIQEW